MVECQIHVDAAHMLQRLRGQDELGHRALAAIQSADLKPFRVVFGGGTAFKDRIGGAALTL